MSATVPPNLPSPSTGTTAPSTGTARGTVVDAPDVSALTRGTPLEGRVVSGSAGQLVIATSAGRLTVQTPASLPAGSPVVIQIQSAGQAPQVVLQFPQTAATQNAAATAVTTPASGETPIPSVNTRLTLGSILQATVVRSTPDASVTTTNPNGAGTQSGTTQGATGTLPNGALPLVNGSGLSLRLLAFAPPGSALAPTAPGGAAQAANALLATVTGQQASGSVLVSANAADLLLQISNTLPAGSKLLFDVVKTYPPTPARSGGPAIGLGARWEALNEALATLQQSDPVLARTVLDARLPNPGPRLGTSMLFFLSAVLSGDVRRFLGADAMRQLNRAGGGVLERLTGELGQLQRPAVDASGQDWRLFPIPLLTEDGLSQLRLLVRDGGNNAGQDTDEGGVRFIVEVEMSRLGPFQFDGLTRKKHLDLVLRTQQELPKTVRETIRSIFGDTLSALGFSGTIAIRTVDVFPVAPVETDVMDHRDLTV